MTRGAAPLAEHAFAIGAIDVTLRTDAPEVLDDFTSLYGPAPVAGERGFEITVTRRGRSWLGRRGYRIEADGAPLSAPRGRDEVLPYLEWAINQRVMETRDDFVQLHAATLVRSGRGVVFAGVSGCGKSTLAAGLVARGWSYLSDEFALIEPATGLLHPYPKAICVKSGAFGLVDRLGLPVSRRRPYIKAWKGGVRYLRPGDVRADAIAAPARVCFVVFPRYAGGERPRLRRCSRARAGVHLASLALNARAHGDTLIPTIAQIVRGARCLSLDTGGLEETAALLDAVVTARDQ